MNRGVRAASRMTSKLEKKGTAATLTIVTQTGRNSDGSPSISEASEVIYFFDIEWSFSESSAGIIQPEDRKIVTLSSTRPTVQHTVIIDDVTYEIITVAPIPVQGVDVAYKIHLRA